MGQKISSAQLNPTVTTDANGWKVYDFGNFKRYVKTFTGGDVNIAANTSSALVSSAALPTGMASLSGKFMQYSVGMQYTYAFVVTQEALGSTSPQNSTSLRFYAWNGGANTAGTGNWAITVTIDE